ncbi:transcriptional repressor [Cytophagaceae bacterium ABcell3]|nr:transcriptional repressor [Cytophagaceae bacterium ABcell3]
MLKAADILKKRKLKATAIRTKLLQSIISSEKALSHAELAEVIVQKADRVSIYRNLIVLTNAELIHKIVDQTGTARYIFNTHQHANEKIGSHPHFKCTNCDMVYCLPDLPKEYLASLSKLHLKNVTFLAEGMCQKCS